MNPASKRFRAGLVVLLGILLGFEVPRIVEGVERYGYTRENSYVLVRLARKRMGEYLQEKSVGGKGKWGKRDSRKLERGRQPSKLRFVKTSLPVKLGEEAVKTSIPELIISGEAGRFLDALFNLFERGMLEAFTDALDKLGFPGKKYSSEDYSQAAKVLHEWLE